VDLRIYLILAEFLKKCSICRQQNIVSRINNAVIIDEQENKKIDFLRKTRI
jgi:hypothetical protein